MEAQKEEPSECYVSEPSPTPMSLKKKGKDFPYK